MVIADSNVWIEYLRHPSSSVGAEFERLLDGNRLFIIGIVVSEVLQGARTRREFGQLLPRVQSVPFVDTTRYTWVKAAELALQLREQGLMAPLTDLVIASIAIENNHEIYTLDQHFQRIPGLKLYNPEKRDYSETSSWRQ